MSQLCPSRAPRQLYLDLSRLITLAFSEPIFVCRVPEGSSLVPFVFATSGCETRTEVRRPEH